MSVIEANVALRIARLILDRDIARIGCHYASTDAQNFDQERYEYHRDQHIRFTDELNLILGTDMLVTFKPRVPRGWECIEGGAETGPTQTETAVQAIGRVLSMLNMGGTK